MPHMLEVYIFLSVRLCECICSYMPVCINGINSHNPFNDKPFKSRITLRDHHIPSLNQGTYKNFKSLFGILFCCSEVSSLTQAEVCQLNSRSSSLMPSLFRGDTHRMSIIIVGKMHFPLQNLRYLTCGVCFLFQQTENWSYQKVTGCLAPSFFQLAFSCLDPFKCWMLKPSPLPAATLFPGGTLDLAP